MALQTPSGKAESDSQSTTWESLACDAGKAPGFGRVFGVPGAGDEVSALFGMSAGAGGEGIG